MNKLPRYAGHLNCWAVWWQVHITLWVDFLFIYFIYLFIIFFFNFLGLISCKIYNSPPQVYYGDFFFFFLTFLRCAKLIFCRLLFSCHNQPSVILQFALSISSIHHQLHAETVCFSNWKQMSVVSLQWQMSHHFDHRDINIKYIKQLPSLA